MPSKLEELRRRAEEAARQIDEKYEIRSKLDQGARTATGALRKGAEATTSALDKAREEASRINREHKITERMNETARRAAETAEDALNRTDAKKKASDAVNEARERAGTAAQEAKEKASDMFGEARRFYENTTGAARAAGSAARLPASLLSAVQSARAWAKRNPGKSAIVSLAFIAGARAGSAFSALDVTLLGAGGAGNWMFHSALVPYGLRKLSEKYERYIKKQEELLGEGKLSEAEAARVKFERDAAKYVGAPLLGAFSIAAGAGLVAEAVTGGVVTGFPINLVLGGNPLLSSIWLFGNGLVCFHNGYKFFMMALADQQEVARVVRDIKGLLPAMPEEGV
ncbi:MAG TPA: hypothetical protein VJZ26_14320 [Blastocatellia bacterium]|nr:hypothetical protein [Blastocatellia bacterium]